MITLGPFCTQMIKQLKLFRHQSGLYRCEASNGVGPHVSQDIRLTVLCKFSLINCVRYQIHIRYQTHSLIHTFKDITHSSIYKFSFLLVSLNHLIFMHHQFSCLVWNALVVLSQIITLLRKLDLQYHLSFDN